METAIVAGIFALTGVALGSVLDWARVSVAGRKALGEQRDEQFTALGTTCVQLLLEIRIMRNNPLINAVKGGFAEQARVRVLPLLSEITILTTRMSMYRDIQLANAARRISVAAMHLLEHASDKDGFDQREEELRMALEQLRNARDMAATSRLRRARRSRLSTIDPPSQESEE